MENIKKLQNDRMSLIAVITAIISIPIIIGYLVTISTTCHKTRDIVDYEPGMNISSCYCTSIQTQASILSQFLKYDYLGQVTDSLTIKYDNNKLYVDFPNFRSAIFYLLQIPSFIPTNHGNISTLVSSSYGISVSFDTWNKQTSSTRVSQLEFNSHPLYQIPFGIKHPGLNKYSIVTYTINPNCEMETESILSLTPGNKINGTALDGGICLYFLGGNVFKNISHLCKNFDCYEIAKLGNDITAALKKDFETRLFTIDPVNYCEIDFCYQSNCENQNIWGSIMLCFTFASTTFMFIKVLFFLHSRRKMMQNETTEKTTEMGTIGTV